MIIRLRNGDESVPLFLFPGAGADARELSALGLSIRSPGAMLGVRPLDLENRLQRCRGGYIDRLRLFSRNRDDSAARPLGSVTK